MGKNVMKKVLAMLLAVSMCLTLIPGTAFATEVSDSVSTETEEAQFLSKDADAPVGMSVEVGKSNVTIHINRVGTSGTAQLVSVDAHEYYKGDKTYGMSKSTNAAGEVIAEYECGTAQDIKINRYDNDGKDHLYTKYYLVQNGKILSGPVYASDIYSLRSVEPFEMVTKKVLHWKMEARLKWLRKWEFLIPLLIWIYVH